MGQRRRDNEMLTPERRVALSAAERFDLAATQALEPLIRSPSGAALGRLGNLADEPPLLALSALTAAAGLVLGRPRLARAGARMISAQLLAASFKEAAKDRIDRTRPMAFLDDGRYRMSRGGSRKAALRAFPSGHTAGAVALARAASRELPVAAPAHALAAALGALQVLRRAHFPGDVLAGAVLGIVAEAIAATIYRAAAGRASPQPNPNPSDTTM